MSDSPFVTPDTTPAQGQSAESNDTAEAAIQPDRRPVIQSPLQGAITEREVARKPLHDGKGDVGYLDEAINREITGPEKVAGTVTALNLLAETGKTDTHVVEIGPGGGAALNALRTHVEHNPGLNPTVTLIEAPGVVSATLQSAMADYRSVAGVELRHGWAQDLAKLLPEPADVVAASALLHEVFSYGKGYYGVTEVLNSLPTAINPGGYFSYRDLFAVDSGSLHDRVEQSYSSRGWVRFISMFAPHYLENGRHPYQGYSDLLSARQDSRPVPIAELDPRKIANLKGPQGLFREIQRHYITARKDALRSGIFGFRPVLEGPQSNDWLNSATGLKRVHFDFTSDLDLTPPPQQTLRAISEPPGKYSEHWTVNGDDFDAVVSIAFGRYLEDAARGDAESQQAWTDWQNREGLETYAYFSRSGLLAAFATESAASGETVLMPARPEHVRTAPRKNYDRILSELPNPMRDAKQLVVFKNIPLDDRRQIDESMKVIASYCTPGDYLEIAKAVHA